MRMRERERERDSDKIARTSKNVKIIFPRATSGLGKRFYPNESIEKHTD